MASRHKAREYALQMLYQVETAGVPIAEVIAHFWGDREVPEEARAFAERLAAGAAGSLPEIDALLSSNLDNWRLERLAVVDRNVLRLAVYEFLHEADTPSVVIIDEAIEIAKRFGGEDSGQFVNGILDALRKVLEAAGVGRSSGAAGGAGRAGSI
jgi:transcription antitermination protein NusB